MFAAERTGTKKRHGVSIIRVSTNAEDDFLFTRPTLNAPNFVSSAKRFRSIIALGLSAAMENNHFVPAYVEKSTF